MNQITRKTELPIPFANLIDDFVEDSYKKHRRNSNFFTKSIVEINEKWFPELDRELDGFWETNQYISDLEYGSEKSEITKLNRVQKITKTITTEEWALV